ncbi:IS66 family insertion sequence element accessory protein TnpB [Sphingobacterium multivorum]|nr:IS66 family insertion sequence element accessory protein TnpB [Sphingobacterium multivorum]
MRKSFDGLCGFISSGMQRQATSGEVFVFLNCSLTHTKLLHWEKGGLYFIINLWRALHFCPQI